MHLLLLENSEKFPLYKSLLSCFFLLTKLKSIGARTVLQSLIIKEISQSFFKNICDKKLPKVIWYKSATQRPYNQRNFRPAKKNGNKRLK
jgi:hypothetical protein